MARPALLALALLLVTFLPVHADEGMWPPGSLEKLPLQELKTRGLELTPEQIYNPQGGGITDAVARLGATASFVSPDGLLITNHHVAFGAIQEQSTTDRNYLRDGFYAATREEEIEAPGYTVTVNVGTEDVTGRVLAGIDDRTSGLARWKKIDAATKRIVADAEKGTDLRCRVVPEFGGKRYVKYVSLEIRDVRIVYVPPEAIGNFGGETDNWMWPRHTGDFSFLRAYVGPDGRPAEPSPKNVPYRPKVFLPISSKGVHTGDLTMTIGFPGRTQRYACSYELANQIDFVLPNSIRNSEETVRIIERAGEGDPEVRLRTSGQLKGINNWLKKNQGVLDGFLRANILQKKIEEEKGLTEFLAQNPSLEKKYGDVLPELEKLYAEQKTTQLRDMRLERLARLSDFYDLAEDLDRRAVEREKPDMERDAGYQDRDTLDARRHQRTAQINLVPAVDKKLLARGLRELCELPPGQKVEAIEKVFGGLSGAALDSACDAFVDDLFARTRIGDLPTRLRMLSLPRKELEALDDPMIRLVVALRPEMERKRERDRTWSGMRERLAPRLVQAYAEWKNGAMYPDANGTLRISFGEVHAFDPRDAVHYEDHTHLAGVLQKDRGDGEFVVPPELKAAERSRGFGNLLEPDEDDIRVDFLTTNDITNGNSGSPVLNGRGEIVGVAFDGNYESVASDFLYDPLMNRTIVVDARYILFLIEDVYHLDRLRGELAVR